MIFAQQLPWRVLALPTPVCLILTLIPPFPLIYLIEFIRVLWRRRQQKKCVQVLKEIQRTHGSSGVLLYSTRTSSQKILESEVFPTLAATPVLWDNGHIGDAAYGCCASVVSAACAAAFPVYMSVVDNRLTVRSLHACVYSGIDVLHPAEDIRMLIQEHVQAHAEI